MTDYADESAAFQQADIERGLKRMELAKRAGRDDCQECGDEIAPMRKDMGAVRCVPCQTAFEAFAKHRRQ